MPTPLTFSEVTALQKDNSYFTYVISVMEMYRQNLLNMSGYKNMLKKAVAQQYIGAMPVLPKLPTAPPAAPEGIFDRVAKLVTRIKASVNYSGEPSNGDTSVSRPILKKNWKKAKETFDL